ncbi:hydroxyacid dehydrogenase [Intestinimonas massiliensis (ex Afouda et al. 2020)]|uniref:Hydroxyacid dehydrogenase n=1 Tax=Intestinimonas massiliensis (ex Afouda et al. 2020) TaxID=1673721 RepID=A0ABS9ME71_9FIRM|nr:hydroxyacid dehydrogenase [Intestinimonas massiliensis (ex Afouda et al. 2020)]MCG4529111.1 hydroxyacid dehydrogenase [Intestinimonas massiliensis (ex Afouda et al. 2020)]
MKVYNPKPLAPVAEQMLKDAGVEIVGSSGPTKEDLIKDVADVDVIVVWLSPNHIDKEVIDAAKKLKLISRFGVGMEIVDVKYAQSKGIMVCNTPFSNINSVAEHAMYLIMACARNSRIVDTKMHSGEFNSIKKISAVELEGSTLGIIGLGNIGKLVAKKASGFDMNIIAWDPFVKEHPGVEMITDLNELLERSDFVTLHTPETPQTIGLIGAEQFKKMKKSAFIINAARGSAIKQNELVEALKAGEIAGAGLDVYASEPLTSDEPLLAMDNVICTPHYAGFTTGAVVKTGIDVAESILSVKDGETPKYLLK